MSSTHSSTHSRPPRPADFLGSSDHTKLTYSPCKHSSSPRPNAIRGFNRPIEVLGGSSHHSPKRSWSPKPTLLAKSPASGPPSLREDSLAASSHHTIQSFTQDCRTHSPTPPTMRSQSTHLRRSWSPKPTDAVRGCSWSPKPSANKVFGYNRPTEFLGSPLNAVKRSLSPKPSKGANHQPISIEKSAFVFETIATLNNMTEFSDDSSSHSDKFMPVVGKLKFAWPPIVERKTWTQQEVGKLSLRENDFQRGELQRNASIRIQWNGETVDGHAAFVHDACRDDEGDEHMDNSNDKTVEKKEANGSDRPSVWATVIDDGTPSSATDSKQWMVKRVWHHDELDTHESLYQVSQGDLMSKLKCLMGVPTGVDVDTEDDLNASFSFQKVIDVEGTVLKESTTQLLNESQLQESILEIAIEHDDMINGKWCYRNGLNQDDDDASWHAHGLAEDEEDPKKKDTVIKSARKEKTKKKSKKKDEKYNGVTSIFDLLSPPPVYQFHTVREDLS